MLIQILILLAAPPTLPTSVPYCPYHCFTRLNCSPAPPLTPPPYLAVGLRPGQTYYYRILGPQDPPGLLSSSSSSALTGQLPIQRYSAGSSAAAATGGARWAVENEKLILVWREHVPDAPPPTDRKGFGTQLIERMLVSGLGAEVERTFHADGLEARFTLRVSNLKSTAEPDEDAEIAET